MTDLHKILPSILLKCLPDILKKVPINDIIDHISLCLSKSDIDELRLSTGTKKNEEAVTQFVKIICDSKDCSTRVVNFIKALQRDKRCIDDVDKILLEIKTVDEHIYQIFRPSDIEERTYPDVTPVVPSTRYTVDNKEIGAGINSGVNCNQVDQSLAHDHADTHNRAGKTGFNAVNKHFERIGRQLPIRLLHIRYDGVYNSLAEELNIGNKWISICNEMHLQRKIVKKCEESEYPAMSLLNHIGQLTIFDLLQCFDEAVRRSILKQIKVELIEEQFAKLQTLENEQYEQLADMLNKESKWKRLANKLRLTREDVITLGNKDNPAMALLDNIRHLTWEQFFQHLVEAGLSNICREIQTPVTSDQCHREFDHNSNKLQIATVLQNTSIQTGTTTENAINKQANNTRLDTVVQSTSTQTEAMSELFGQNPSNSQPEDTRLVTLIQTTSTQTVAISGLFGQNPSNEQPEHMSTPSDQSEEAETETKDIENLEIKKNNTSLNGSQTVMNRLVTQPVQILGAEKHPGGDRLAFQMDLRCQPNLSSFRNIQRSMPGIRSSDNEIGAVTQTSATRNKERQQMIQQPVHTNNFEKNSEQELFAFNIDIENQPSLDSFRNIHIQIAGNHAESSCNNSVLNQTSVKISFGET